MKTGSNKCNCGHEKNEHADESKIGDHAGYCLIKNHTGSYPPNVCCCVKFVLEQSNKGDKK